MMLLRPLRITTQFDTIRNMRSNGVVFFYSTVVVTFLILGFKSSHAPKSQVLVITIGPSAKELLENQS